MKASFFAAILICTTSGAYAQYLSAEPPPGALGVGQVVLVDNGQCGKGKVLQVTGGNNMSGVGSQVTKGLSGRQRKCVKKPS